MRFQSDEQRKAVMARLSRDRRKAAAGAFPAGFSMGAGLGYGMGQMARLQRAYPTAVFPHGAPLGQAARTIGKGALAFTAGMALAKRYAKYHRPYTRKRLHKWNAPGRDAIRHSQAMGGMAGVYSGLLAGTAAGYIPVTHWGAGISHGVRQGIQGTRSHLQALPGRIRKFSKTPKTIDVTRGRTPFTHMERLKRTAARQFTRFFPKRSVKPGRVINLKQVRKVKLIPHGH